MSIETWALKCEHWNLSIGSGWEEAVAVVMVENGRKGTMLSEDQIRAFTLSRIVWSLFLFSVFFLVSVFRCCSWYAATGHIFCTQAILRPRSSFGINKVDCGLPSYPKKYKGHGHSAQVPNCSSGYPDTPWITKSYTDRFLIYTWNLSKIRINYTISLQLHCCCTGMQLAGMTVSIHTYYTGKYTHENKRWPGDLWRLRTWVRLT